MDGRVRHRWDMTSAGARVNPNAMKTKAHPQRKKRSVFFMAWSTDDVHADGVGELRERGREIRHRL